MAALGRVEAAAARGHWCAGYVAYEAAPAFEPRMEVVPGGAMPLLLFGVYAAPSPSDARSWAHEAVSESQPLEWIEQMTESEFLDAIAAIHSAIAAGESALSTAVKPMTGGIAPMSTTLATRLVP